MALFDRSRARPSRVDPRKLKGDGFWRRVQDFIAGPRNMLRLAVLLLLAGGTLLLLHAPYEPMRYARGEKADRTFEARVDFQYVDTAATEALRREAQNNTPNVYERLPTQSVQLSEEFRRLLTQAVKAATPPSPPRPPPPREGGPAEEATPPAEAPEASPAEAAPKTPPSATPGAPDQPPAAGGDEESTADKTDYAALWGVSDQFDQFKALAKDPEKLRALQAAFQSLLTYADSLPVLTTSQYSTEAAGKNPQIYVVSKKGDLLQYDLVNTDPDVLEPDKVSKRREYETKIAAQVDRVFSDIDLSPAVRKAIVARFVTTMAPNLRYSNSLTEAKKQEAASQVQPKIERFSEGVVLVQVGETIDETKFAILSAEHKAYLESIAWWGRLGALVGSVIIVGLLTYILVGYTVRYQHNVADRIVRAFILVVLFLLVMALARFFQTYFQRSMLIFPLTTAAMVVTVAYNRRFALFVTWIMAILVTMVARIEDYSTVVLLLIGTSVAIMQLREIRTRSKPVAVGLVTGLVYFFSVWGLELADLRVFSWEEAQETLQRSSIAFLAGLLPGFIILGVLPFIERAFNVVTSIRLLELCDANQPALRKLAIEAPGTYSHSLLLGSLVEPAAEAVDADGLLARVGAYFHDIGKVNKPQYFVENQGQLANSADHAKLKPQMSKLIILSHIKDGLEMARQYGLPRAINAFIAEHHGTTIMEYFYQEARKSDEKPVDETEFRYPGPKPQSKETAILMLADSCEGAVRSIKEPTAPKIEDKVHEIVMKRLLDGQLDESGLTLNEVRDVEQSLTKSLISVYHGRISYPESTDETAGGGTESAPQAPVAGRPGLAGPGNHA